MATYRVSTEDIARKVSRLKEIGNLEKEVQNVG